MGIVSWEPKINLKKNPAIIHSNCLTAIILERSQKTASGMEAASVEHRDTLRLPVS